MLRFLAHYPTIKAIPRPTTLVRPRIPPPNIINIYHQKFPSHFNSNLRTNQQGVPNLNSKNPDPMSAANNSAELVYNQDGFISDITQETLQTEIAKTLGIKYLSNATGNNALHSPRSVHGYIHGVGARSIVPFLVFLEGPPLWIFFMFDTGAPQTFITAQAGKAIGLVPDPQEPGTILNVGGYLTPVFISPDDCLFSNINLLGTVFCRCNHVYVVEVYFKCTVCFHFSGKWKLMEKTHV